MRTLFLLIALLVCGMGAKAQIGYQISLLNTATGEPRANETVVVSVTLSNSAGEAFYSETKSTTTNDFGVLSLSIGNADTFKNVDLSKMPFYIEVTANGVMIGKSQILNVPVAEIAKKIAPIDKKLIMGTWRASMDGRWISYTFNENGTVSYEYHVDNYKHYTLNGIYEIEGSNIYVRIRDNEIYSVDKTFRYMNGTIGTDFVKL